MSNEGFIQEAINSKDTYIFKDKEAYKKGHDMMASLGFKLVSRNRTLVYYQKELNSSVSENIVFDVNEPSYEVYTLHAIQPLDEINVAMSRLSITKEIDQALYFLKKGLGWF